jgi:SAM-dependent methyltransferase
METVLFISHPQKQCGVHEFGKNIAEALRSSTRYNIVYVECSGISALYELVETHQPAAIIYNYYASTMPWLTRKIIHKFRIPQNRKIKVPQIGILHEVTQYLADRMDNRLFDYYIGPDPTLLLKNPIVFKTGRLIVDYANQFPLPEVPVIGSFGFATPNKGFEELVKAVQTDYDKAVIRFNIPAADFGDKEGANARKIAEDCRKLIVKPGIELKVTHDFFSRSQLMEFLAQNTVNVFLYQDKQGRGISSTIDYALGVDRPLVVSDSIMFRHLHQVTPSIVYGRNSIRQIVENGVAPLAKLKEEWNSSNLVWEYERIITAVLKREQQKEQPGLHTYITTLKNLVRKLLGMPPKGFTWLRNTNQSIEDVLTVDKKQTYTPVQLPAGTPLNRILDNTARAQYQPAIDKLKELVPLTMQKKIAAANVQQGFVFDTVYSYIKQYNGPKILCVGSYEDTAAMSLIRMGYPIEEIDPVLNYYLQEYASKPTTEKQSYDIIFSTSVIEHDPDDESFVQCINDLLAPGGVAVITCDYKDQWKPGDPKPEVDARFYTQNDLRKRLLAFMPDCRLVDEPQWDCPHPDFTYLGKYQYTFATFVLKKIK